MQRFLPVFVLSAGLLLWLINLLHARPLFLDEANVARNLFDRSYTGLLLPLDHDQYAPPLYLWLTKLMGETFGYGEVALRIPAFLGGLLAAASLYLGGRRLLPGGYAVLPLLFLFVNPHVLQYVSEVKPYGVDLGVAAALLTAALIRDPDRPSLVLWALGGAVAVWLSLPSVFVLAAVGLYGLYHDLRWVWPIAVWLLSFGLLYTVLLRPYLEVSVLQAYHEAYFLDPTSPSSVVSRLAAIGRLAFGHTVVAIGGGGLLLVYGVWKESIRSFWCTFPLLIVLIVSVGGYYSLIDRLMLFALPGLWLVASLGVHRLVSLSRLAWIPVGLLLIFVLGSTKVWRYYTAPQVFSDGRRLAREVKASKLPVRLHHLARPVIDYYARIHPNTRFDYREQEEPKPGRYRKFFAVLTAPSVRQAVEHEQRGAAARGCRVDRKNLYRAVILTIRCPAPNSDP